MKISRIEGLADGIFAISMTLLVLELHIPRADADLQVELLQLWPQLLSLVISFIILGIYWGAHHILLARLKEVTFPFMWRNVYFLLPISLVPFATGLLGEHPYSQLAQSVYAADLALCGILLFSAIHYALKHPELFIAEPSMEFKRNVATKILLPVVTYGLAVVGSFVHPMLGLLLLAVGPLIYFVPIDTKTWELLVKPTEWVFRLVTGKQTA